MIPKEVLNSLGDFVYAEVTVFVFHSREEEQNLCDRGGPLQHPKEQMGKGAERVHVHDPFGSASNGQLVVLCLWIEQLDLDVVGLPDRSTLPDDWKRVDCDRTCELWAPCNPNETVQVAREIQMAGFNMVHQEVDTDVVSLDGSSVEKDSIVTFFF